LYINFKIIKHLIKFQLIPAGGWIYVHHSKPNITDINKYLQKEDDKPSAYTNWEDYSYLDLTPLGL